MRVVSEYARSDRVSREAAVERWRRIGEELDADLVAIHAIGPGVLYPPVVYRRHSDGTFLVWLGKHGEVAGTEDPEEERAQARLRVTGKTERLGAWRVRARDLMDTLRRGIHLYTPEGFVQRTVHDPQTDPPLIAP